MSMAFRACSGPGGPGASLTLGLPGQACPRSDAGLAEGWRVGPVIWPGGHRDGDGGYQKLLVGFGEPLIGRVLMMDAADAARRRARPSRADGTESVAR